MTIMDNKHVSEDGMTANLPISLKYTISFSRFHCCGRRGIPCGHHGLWPSCNRPDQGRPVTAQRSVSWEFCLQLKLKEVALTGNAETEIPVLTHLVSCHRRQPSHQFLPESRAGL